MSEEKKIIELTDSIEESQVPELIQNQFEQLHGLRNEILKATNNAYDAKESVINEVDHKTFGKKDAIKNLQHATLNLANAQIDAMKAQKKSFEYQQKLSEISKYLFCLGLSNIAMNRAVVRELENKLKNASKEELDEMAREEIVSLLRELKKREDVEQKQQDISQRQKQLKQFVDSQAKITEAQDQELLNQAKKDEEHDRRLDELFVLFCKQEEIIGSLLQEMEVVRKELLVKDEEIRELRALVEQR